MPHRGQIGQAKPSSFRRIGQVLDYTSLGMNFVGSALAESGVPQAVAAGGGLMAGSAVLGVASTAMDVLGGNSVMGAARNLATGALTSSGVSSLGGSIAKALR